MKDDFDYNRPDEEDDESVPQQEDDSSLYDKVNDVKEKYDKGKDNVEKLKKFREKLDKGKQVGKNTTQQGGKQAAKEGAKQASKKGTQEAGKQAAKKGAQEAGKQAAKQAGKEAAKTAAKAGAKTAVAASGAATAGIGTAVAVGMEVADKLNQIKKKIDNKVNDKIKENTGIDVKKVKKITKIAIILLPLFIFLFVLNASAMFLASEETYDDLYNLVNKKQVAEAKDSTITEKISIDGKPEADMKIKPLLYMSKANLDDLVNDYKKYLEQQKKGDYNNFMPADDEKDANGNITKSGQDVSADLVRKYLNAAAKNFSVINWEEKSLNKRNGLYTSGSTISKVQDLVKVGDSWLDNAFNDYTRIPNPNKYKVSPETKKSEKDNTEEMKAVYYNMTKPYLQNWVVPYALNIASQDNRFGKDVLDNMSNPLTIQLLKLDRLKRTTKYWYALMVDVEEKWYEYSKNSIKFQIKYTKETTSAEINKWGIAGSKEEIINGIFTQDVDDSYKDGTPYKIGGKYNGGEIKRFEIISDNGSGDFHDVYFKIVYTEQAISAPISKISSSNGPNKYNNTADTVVDKVYNDSELGEGGCNTNKFTVNNNFVKIQAANNTRSINEKNNYNNLAQVYKNLIGINIGDTYDNGKITDFIIDEALLHITEREIWRKVSLRKDASGEYIKSKDYSGKDIFLDKNKLPWEAGGVNPRIDREFLEYKTSPVVVNTQGFYQVSLSDANYEIKRADESSTPNEIEIPADGKLDASGREKKIDYFDETIGSSDVEPYQDYKVSYIEDKKYKDLGRKISRIEWYMDFGNGGEPDNKNTYYTIFPSKSDTDKKDRKLKYYTYANYSAIDKLALDLANIGKPPVWVQGHSYDELQFGFKQIEKYYGIENTNNNILGGLIDVGSIPEGGFIWPAYASDGSKATHISSKFGPRTLSNGDSNFHNGIDITDSTQNTEITAIQSGRILQVVRQYTGSNYPGGPPTLGNCVKIEHTDANGNPNGWVSIYGHLKIVYSKSSDGTPIEVGQNIKVGQKIGIMGTTGYSTGIHLHFQVEQNGTAINPEALYNNFEPISK